MASDYITHGTITTNGNMVTLSPVSGNRPDKTPSGLIATRAVESMAGWLGQVIVDKSIVWQSPEQESSDDAIDMANSRVVDAVKLLFDLLTSKDAAPTITEWDPKA